MREVLAEPTEFAADATLQPLTHLRGDVEFRNVGFEYAPAFPYEGRFVPRSARPVGCARRAFGRRKEHARLTRRGISTPDFWSDLRRRQDLALSTLRLSLVHRARAAGFVSLRRHDCGEHPHRQSEGDAADLLHAARIAHVDEFATSSWTATNTSSASAA
jgi:hypothetical protein